MKNAVMTALLFYEAMYYIFTGEILKHFNPNIGKVNMTKLFWCIYRIKFKFVD